MRVRAFTLVELLVSIAIVAVLLGVLLPVLAGARGTARMNAKTQLARQLTLALTAYGGDNRDGLPFFGTPGNALGPIRIRGFEVGGEFFTRQRWLWTSAVYPEYLDAARSAIESEPRARHMQGTLGWPEFVVAGDFQLTSTAFAAPAFWVDDGPMGSGRWDESLLRQTRFAEIQHPSAKGLLGEDLAGPRGMGEAPEKVIAVGDGSARVVDWRQLDPAGAVRRPWGVAGVPIEATRGGLGGVDF